MRCAQQFLRRIVRDREAVALTEFALVMPVLIAFGMYATETAYMTSVDMQLSEITLAVGDNASRLGQADNSAVTPTITEGDIDSVMKGANVASGPLALATNGRIILSSVERDSASGKQYIHWQRCYGTLAGTSAYGNDTTANGLSGAAITGITMGGATITAASNSAVMVAEVFYQYKGLFGSMFYAPFTIRQQAVFVIRDQRNIAAGLTGTGSSKCT